MEDEDEVSVWWNLLWLLVPAIFWGSLIWGVAKLWRIYIG